MVSRSCRYSGLATFKNSARTQIMKSWPTFSSGESLCKVFSAHFSPSRSSCTRPTGWYLSLAKAGQTRNAVSKTRASFRGMSQKIARLHFVFLLLPATGPIGPFTEALAADTLWLSSFRGRAVRPNVPRLIYESGTFCFAPEKPEALSSRFRLYIKGIPYQLNRRLLDRPLVAKSCQPRNLRFPSEPCHLPLGVVTMCLLRRLQRRSLTNLSTD